MSYLDVKKWSTTAANNVLANTGITWDEGMAPSSVNDSARATMAALAAWYQASYSAFQARLTLTSGTPVTAGDVTGAGTIYLTPYKGNQIWLYDGSAQWNLFNLTEISLALTLTNGKPYDVFCYDNAGTPTLEVLVWTNDTTRATALTTQNGIYVKSGATTRRYVGTIYASGANTTEDSLAKRYVWNMYNRVARAMRVKDTTDSWSYSTQTYRQANASTANQLDMVRGLDEDYATATVTGGVSTDQVSARAVYVGVGLDSTTTLASDCINGIQQVTNTAIISLVAKYAGLPGVGRHFLTRLEAGGGADTQTWFGDNGGSFVNSGIVGETFA